jgi:prepilin-type N-terminal cleavage/methylation domain-containing protein
MARRTKLLELQPLTLRTPLFSLVHVAAVRSWCAGAQTQSDSCKDSSVGDWGNAGAGSSDYALPKPGGRASLAAASAREGRIVPLVTESSGGPARVVASLGLAGCGSARGRRSAPPVDRTGGGPGFSLVEILTVVALIGILAALSIPGYSSMVYASRQAGCVNNIRTTGAALLAYAADHNNYFPHKNGHPYWNTIDPLAKELVGANGAAGYLPFRSYPDLKSPLWSDALHSPLDPNAAHYRKERGYSDSYIYRQGHNSPGGAKNGQPMRPGLLGPTETKPRWLLAGRWGGSALNNAPEKDPHGRGWKPSEVLVKPHPSGWWIEGRAVDCPWYRKPGTWVFYEDGSVRWRSHPGESLGL